MTMFSVDKELENLEYVSQRDFTSLGILERQDLERWAIENPRLLGEELLIITSEYENFDRTSDRLDILALDPQGKLVVVELKRDRADKTTDLQAIKYASYCATLTAEDIQKEYREFWNARQETEVTPEEVGDIFTNFLSQDLVDLTPDGWADFELDDQPRLLLVAGSFGVEITSPVMWLTEEYGLDITCVRIDAYEHQDRILLNTQQVIPLPEAEDYVTKRREKERKQSISYQQTWTLTVLLDRGILVPGDELVFSVHQVPDDAEREWNENYEFWRARVTGKTGQSDALQWLYDDQLYSITGAAKQLLFELVGRDKSKELTGYRFWAHPEFGNRTLQELRESKETALERKTIETLTTN